MVTKQAGIQKLRVSLIQIKVHSGERDFDKCAATFFRVINSLGAARLSKKSNTASALFEFFKTTRLLKKYNRRKILGFPPCTDLSIRSALSAHYASIVHLYLANPNLYILATCKAVQWSLK